MYLYAVSFEGGLIKVGRSSTPKKRVAQHVGSLAPVDIRAVDSYFAKCDGDIEKAEGLLIEKCAAHAASTRKREWFTGLILKDVTGWIDEACASKLIHAPASPRFALRPSGPWIDASGSYICRACCKFFAARDATSGFLCAECVGLGYTFVAPKRRKNDPAICLSLNGVEVCLWSGAVGEPDAIPYWGVTCEELRPDTAWLRLPAGDPKRGSIGKALCDYSPPGNARDRQRKAELAKTAP